MAIEWMDNFSQYGDDETYMLDGLWAERYAINAQSPTLEDDPDGVSTGKVIFLRQGGIRRVLSSSQTTMGVGFRLYMANLPGSAALRYRLLELNSLTNVVNVGVLIETTGAISVYRGEGGNGTLLGTTPVPVLTAGTWQHIEIKAFFNDTTGTVEVRVNEEVVIDLTGEDTVASTVECSQIVFTGETVSSQTSECYIKDVIVWNGSGTENNDFLGDCQIVTLLPTSDDTFAGWTSTGANGFSVIDETTPNDADYIQADNSPPAAVLFGLTDLDVDITTVLGLQTVVRAQKTDGGTATLQVGLKSGGSTDEGADNPLSTSASYLFDVSELDPGTGLPWDPSAVDAALLKINRTT